MGEFEFDFAEWLGNEMEQTGMTIQELADKSGLVKQTIFYYLMGDRSPSLISFILILNAFGKRFEIVDNKKEE